MTEEQKRAKFEEVLFKDFFVRSVKVGTGQWMSCTDVSKAELCKRDEDGRYADKYIDAMWYGYCLHEDT